MTASLGAHVAFALVVAATIAAAASKSSGEEVHSPDEPWVRVFLVGAQQYDDAERLCGGSVPCDVQRLLAGAVSAFQQALALNAGCWQCHYNLGSIGLRQHRDEQAALRHFTAAAELTDDPLPHNKLAMLAAARGDLETVLRLHVKSAASAAALGRPLEQLAALGNGLGILVHQMDAAIVAGKASPFLDVSKEAGTLLPSIALLRQQVIRGHVLWRYNGMDADAEARSLAASLLHAARVTRTLVALRACLLAAAVDPTAPPLATGNQPREPLLYEPNPAVLYDNFFIGAVADSGAADWVSQRDDILPMLTRLARLAEGNDEATTGGDWLAVQEGCSVTATLNALRAAALLLLESQPRIGQALAGALSVMLTRVAEQEAHHRAADAGDATARGGLQPALWGDVAVALLPELETVLTAIARSLRLFRSFWLSYFDVPAALLATVARIVEPPIRSPWLRREGALPWQLQALQSSSASTREALMVAARNLRRQRPPRLTIAYVSGDLREHIIGWIMHGVLAMHDRSAVRAIAYQTQPALKHAHRPSSDPVVRGVEQALVASAAVDVKAQLQATVCAMLLAPQHDDNSRRLIASMPVAARLACASDGYFAVDAWPDEAGSDDHLVQHMRSDQRVHVAVDLTGSTHGGRPNIWRRNLAGVKLHYLSSPASMLDDRSRDFTIIDAHAAPPDLVFGQHQQQHARGATPAAGGVFVERLLYIPTPFMPPALPVTLHETEADAVLAEARLRELEAIGVIGSDSQAGAAAGPPLPLPVQVRRRIISAAFNLGVLKLEPRMFTAWLHIMMRAGSEYVLLLRSRAAPDEDMRRALRAEAAARGIHPARLVFAGSLHRHHFQRLGRSIALALDTRVYGMHSATADAAAAGVPTVLLEAGNPASRVGGSVVASLAAASTPSADQWDPGLLVTHSLSELEDVAVRMLHSDAVQEAARCHLYSLAAGGHSLQLAWRVTRNLERAFQVAVELSSLRRQLGNASQVDGQALLLPPPPPPPPWHGVVAATA